MIEPDYGTGELRCDEVQHQNAVWAMWCGGKVSGEAFVDRIGHAFDVGNTQAVFEVSRGEVKVEFFPVLRGDIFEDGLPFGVGVLWLVNVLDHQFFSGVVAVIFPISGRNAEWLFALKPAKEDEFATGQSEGGEGVLDPPMLRFKV